MRLRVEFDPRVDVGAGARRLGESRRALIAVPTNLLLVSDLLHYVHHSFQMPSQLLTISVDGFTLLAAQRIVDVLRECDVLCVNCSAKRRRVEGLLALPAPQHRHALMDRPSNVEVASHATSWMGKGNARVGKNRAGPAAMQPTAVAMPALPPSPAATTVAAAAAAAAEAESEEADTSEATATTPLSPPTTRTPTSCLVLRRFLMWTPRNSGDQLLEYPMLEKSSGTAANVNAVFQLFAPRAALRSRLSRMARFRLCSRKAMGADLFPSTSCFSSQWQGQQAGMHMQERDEKNGQKQRSSLHQNLQMLPQKKRHSIAFTGTGRGLKQTDPTPTTNCQTQLSRC